MAVAIDGPIVVNIAADTAAGVSITLGVEVTAAGAAAINGAVAWSAIGADGLARCNIANKATARSDGARTIIDAIAWGRIGAITAAGRCIADGVTRAGAVAIWSASRSADRWVRVADKARRNIGT